MRSSRARNLLNAYLERELDPETQSRLEDVLERDPELRRELRELEATLALLRGLPQPEAPPGLAGQVMARVRAGEAQPVGLLDVLGRLFEPAFLVPAAAAAVALTVFVGVPGVGQRGDGSQPQQLARSGPAEPSHAPRDPALEARLDQRVPRYDVTRILRGAGHPHSASFASHLEGEGDIAFASFSPR